MRVPLNSLLTSVLDRVVDYFQVSVALFSGKKLPPPQFPKCPLSRRLGVSASVPVWTRRRKEKVSQS